MALLQNYRCEFSARDVYRMELIVMQKLDFKLTNHTPYDFLKIVSILLVPFLHLFIVFFFDKWVQKMKELETRASSSMFVCVCVCVCVCKVSF